MSHEHLLNIVVAPGVMKCKSYGRITTFAQRTVDIVFRHVIERTLYNELDGFVFASPLNRFCDCWGLSGLFRASARKKETQNRKWSADDKKFKDGETIE